MHDTKKKGGKSPRGEEKKPPQRELNSLKDKGETASLPDLPLITILPTIEDPDPWTYMEEKDCASAVLYSGMHSKNLISVGKVDVRYKGTDEKGNALCDIVRGDKILKSDITVAEGNTVTVDIGEEGLSVKISAREITSSSATVDIEVKAGYPGYPTDCGCEPIL